MHGSKRTKLRRIVSFAICVPTSARLGVQINIAETINVRLFLTPKTTLVCVFRLILRSVYVLNSADVFLPDLVA